MSKSLILTPQETYEFITAALAVRQVPYIAGPPAIGKSQIVHQVADDANAKMIDLRLSQMLSEDLTGIPERDETRGKAYYLPFETFPLEGDEIPEGYHGWILFLDELSSASEEVLAAAYSLILDRMVGGRKLHSKCLVVAAGNRATDSAIARQLPDTLITRMLPCEMKPNVKDWTFWAKTHKKANETVVEFVKKNPNILYNPVNPDNREENETYPSPRGWEKVFAHVNEHEKRVAFKAQSNPKTDSAGIPVPVDPEAKPMEPLDDMTFHLISAAVGPIAARDFKEDYDESIKLPPPWEIAQAPASARIPNTGIAKAKLTGDLSDYFTKSDEQTRDGLLKYMNRMPEEYRTLFCNNLKNELSDRNSDKRLLQDVHDRLSIDSLFGGLVQGADPEGNNSPF